jgi:Family of unknown function (DUF6544)
MKTLFLIIIAFHGLIHLMGFVKAFNLAEISQLKQSISKISGIIWLLTSLLFLCSVGLYIFQKQEWIMVATVAVILSQVIIIQSWTEAKFGTIANVIILIPTIISLLYTLPSSYKNIYKTEVQYRLTDAINPSILNETDISSLPEPVRRYLHYVGAVGKPKVLNFKAVINGRMRFTKEGKWMEIYAQQYNFTKDPARLFFIEAKMFGIPFEGLHLYIDGDATMQIKVASAIKIVDARGTEMNQGETVTLFNDMCLLAPATLIDPNIQWQSLDSLTVIAKFSHKGKVVTARLYFNQKGELINFVSNDRYQSTDGKTYNNYPWSTPVKDYKESGGRKIPAYGEAVWHTPEGSFTYAKFYIMEIEYNCKT